MPDKKKLTVNTPWCIGCWACVWLCPDLFEFNENSKSIVKRQPKNEEEWKCAKQAENGCPVNVIHIIDEEE